MRKLMFALIAGALLAGPAIAAEFTDAQKRELGPLIREYLLNNPEVVREAMEALERKQAETDNTQRKAAISQNAKHIYNSKGDLVAGNPQGSVTMVEFFDYNCGYCKRAFPDVVKMTETDAYLKLVMKEFPILGPGSVYAARAALASRKQGKYWEFHIAMMAHEGRIDEATADELAKSVGLDLARLKQDMQAPEVAEIINGNMKLAETLAIQGTPAFIIDETVIPGAVGYEALAATVKQVRDNGGCKLC